jgi:adhesin transport system membrane fusion protein
MIPDMKAKAERRGPATHRSHSPVSTGLGQAVACGDSASQSLSRSSIGAPLFAASAPVASAGAGSAVLAAIVLLSVAVIAWASHSEIDRVTRATGQLIASTRVQVIQASEAGVVQAMLVREGDAVEAGQVLAELDPTRARAALRESEARVAALEVAIGRLRAEASMAEDLIPTRLAAAYPALAGAQQALFTQRRVALQTEVGSLEASAALARQELALVDRLYRSGDVSQAEWIRAMRMASDAEAQPAIRRQRFLQEASQELARAEEELAQIEQVFVQRRQALEALVLRAPVRGIVQNIRVTTRGGVLRAGEELMQIVPADDRLLVEARIRPSDIGDLRPGLPVSIKFDAWDYTVHGSVSGRLSYISADTVRDDSRSGDPAFYRVHVETDIPPGAPAVTQLGRSIEVMPGMTAAIDIRTGTRSALSYFLAPLRRGIDEAFTER